MVRTTEKVAMKNTEDRDWTKGSDWLENVDKNGKWKLHNRARLQERRRSPVTRGAEAAATW